MTNKLKPCPFCGGVAETHVYGATGEWIVQCPCGAEINRLVYTEAEAITAWNTRAERTCKTIPVQSGWDYVDGCSNCGEYFPWAVLKNAVSYCPNCGAKVVDK